jgi:S1-C subfamily serine protease
MKRVVEVAIVVTVLAIVASLTLLPTYPGTFGQHTLASCGVVTDGNGWGSVVAIGPDLLLTAGHCIGHPDTYVEIQGKRYEILDQWRSEDSDVGFIRVDGALPYLEFGTMPSLLDTVYLVGSPYDQVLVNTVTKGIVSGFDRAIYDWEHLIQTDAEAAPGSSGGPLFDIHGRIIGICVAGPNPGGGVTLCVPVSDILVALEVYCASHK